ncbi:MAG: hypothetical protein A3K03_04245 [Bdellovibrionales bacterium RIFOXYD1_FULL_44_7]|nr:MAG: hypothetical protein A3K03_04245 [Bdellovibrionales bacterium RIFOXYD1_FULL_44_7]
MIRRRLLPLTVFTLVLGIVMIAAGDNAGSAAEEDAKTEASPTPEASLTPEVSISPSPVSIKQVQPSACLADPLIIEEIRKRNEEIEQRRKGIEAKEAELQARERALDEELEKLEAVRDEITKTEIQLQKDNEEKVNKLVETFETMSPKATAQVLATLDEGLAVAAMSRMTTLKLAKVMNVMEPGKTSRLSEIMAGLVRARSISRNQESAIASSDATRTGKVSEKGGVKNGGPNELNTGVTDKSAGKQSGPQEEQKRP